MPMTPSRVGEWVAYTAYTILWTLLLPGLVLVLAAIPRHRPLLARFRPGPPPPAGAIWVHACSVGEVNAARPLIDALASRIPGAPVFLTVSTRTGQARAAEALPDIPRAWFPFDHPLLARWFMAAAQPRALVLVETEWWPGVMRAAQRQGVPIILANGRVSDKHFERYRRIPWLVEPMMRAVACAAMQSQRYANRVQALGLDAGRVHVCGSVKFDGAALEPPAGVRERLADAVQPAPGKPLVVLGSSRPGDEARVVAAWESIRPDCPGVQLAIAPRHPGRIAEAERACVGHPTRRRGQCTGENPWRGEGVLLLDTLGELLALYAPATVVIIGGSFDPAIQGHNPIEPAALGKPVLFGPHMRNFEEAAEVLLEAGAAVRVSNGEDLAAVLKEVLQDHKRLGEMGEAGRAVVLSQQGAGEKMAFRIAEILENA